MVVTKTIYEKLSRLILPAFKGNSSKKILNFFRGVGIFDISKIRECVYYPEILGII
jgi:hypothetical protein